MKVVGMIPARYESSRFPGKPLAEISGKTLIERVWNQSVQAIDEEDLYVLTDDERIKNHCVDRRMQCLLTSSDCLTGTDRLYEASLVINSDIYINIQGDEPLINPSDVKKIINASKNDPKSIINAMCPIMDEADYFSESVPKVVTDRKNKLLYISRAPIPFAKDKKYQSSMKQVCIYAFPKNKLHFFGTQTEKSKLESIEDIEILRFIENDIDIKMVEVSSESIAVDHPEDIERVVHELNLRK
tara:strand:- start:13495 stop:14223 length:729 start_codon:yes stop_codon:yes gene_type:complete